MVEMKENMPPVSIKRLQSTEDTQVAYCCMTEVPTPWPQALCQCRDWISANLGKHVEGYHLQTAGGAVIGHVYFAISEQALFPYEVEPGVAILYCEWVQQPYQGMGLGKRLFEAFLTDLRQENSKGLLVETTDIEGQMHFSHYLSRGFEIVHESGHRKLLFLPLARDRVTAHPMQAKLQPRRGIPVEITILKGYLCPYEVSTHVLVRQVAQEFGDQVSLQEIWLTPETLKKYGIANGVFINGKQKLAGGEAERAIRQAIMDEL
jgi:GNAT superfamily N-acetyltransferase